METRCAFRAGSSPRRSGPSSLDAEATKDPVSPESPNLTPTTTSRAAGDQQPATGLHESAGLVLKHVGVGKVRLAVTPAEMAKALRSPETDRDGGLRSPWLKGWTPPSQGHHPGRKRFNYKARSRAGALGLLQLMPSTAERFGVLDPFDPRQNISGGVKYLKWLHDYYAGDLIRVVAPIRGRRCREQAQRHPTLPRDASLCAQGAGPLPSQGGAAGSEPAGSMALLQERAGRVQGG